MLVDLLFGEYRQRVLGLLLLHPDTSYHVRELARLTGTTAGTLHRELSKLAEAGLLLREKQGNQVRYRANLDCPLFPELASVFRKTSGLAGVLAQALSALDGQCELAFVFGSVARGEETTHSDIDLLVIGDASFGDVVKALYPCQSTLQREINPVLYSRAEFVQRRHDREALVADIMAKPKIFVKGCVDDLGKFAGH